MRTAALVTTGWSFVTGPPPRAKAKTLATKATGVSPTTFTLSSAAGAVEATVKLSSTTEPPWVR